MSIYILYIPFKSQLNEALNISISFLITRHPFERLLSAYRDKLQYALPHTFHQKLGNMIVRKFRKPVSYERGDNTHHPLMNNAHSYLQAKAKKVGTRWPTFSEFVEFLLFEAAHDADLGKILSYHTPKNYIYIAFLLYFPSRYALAANN